MDERRRPESSFRARRRASIYLLPNLFTTASAVLGLLRHRDGDEPRVRERGDGDLRRHRLDGLDGRVARLTHTQSEFGARYDSMSDMVSFGVAPAVTMYEWG